ncbi:MAG TPA: hypothetical protein V6C91_02270 [Coleofasciculaceae cyanobacterium]
MKLLLVIFLLFYLLMAHRFFNVWLKFFQKDTSMSPEERQFSRIVLIIGTALWPVVVPTAYLSLLEKKLEIQAESLDETEPMNFSCL